jgi:hypothetical protein
MKIHDHFEGTEHCIECEGRCQLTGEDMALSEFLRNTFEYFSWDHKDWMPPNLEKYGAELLGPRWLEYRKHGQEVMRDIKSRINSKNPA